MNENNNRADEMNLEAFEWKIDKACILLQAEVQGRNFLHRQGRVADDE